MIPVLHPSMYNIEFKADNSHNGGCNGSSNGSSNGDYNGSSNGGSNEPMKKNETTIANGLTIFSMPSTLRHMHSRIRSYVMSLRRHRSFHHYLFFLWGLSVTIAINVNWLAWTGETIIESFTDFVASVTYTPVDVCFITAQYASSEENLDNIVNLREEAPSFFSYKNSDHFHFFAFTNRRDWIEAASSTKEDKRSKGKAPAGKDNGWTILVQEFPPQRFQRFITQSRWPKFQGFRHERIQKSCDVVFYMDGTVLPVGTPWKFQKEALRILDSKVQLSQERHPHQHRDGGGIAGEMERCRKKKKDIESNLQKTMVWLKAQPDFTNDCTMYQNTFFGYAVSSPSFRSAADFAWGHFSLEQDSWRDQPLWCYTMHHFGVTPLIIPGNLFQYQGKRRPANKHTYGEEAANNAQKYYDNTTNAKSTTSTTDSDKTNTISGNDLKGGSSQHKTEAKK